MKTEFLSGSGPEPTSEPGHESTPEVAAARAIATIAHRGQTDRIGVAYIEHPRRVAARLSDPRAMAAAWLHDVIEDCGISAEELIKAGIGRNVVDAVVLLTRTEEVDQDAYYRAIRSNPIALAVKLADIADNNDEQRTSQLEPADRERLAEKYRHALEMLEG
jgi:(p)ppGpp synthase/HD superfamily hydrolase